MPLRYSIQVEHRNKVYLIISTNPMMIAQNCCMQVVLSAEYLRYINSPEWKDLRRQKLLEGLCTCELCTQVDRHNDVHHVVYNNLWDCTTADLRILCRPCHDLVHRMLKAYPSVKKMPTNKLKWQQLCCLIDKHAFGPREWNPRNWRRENRNRR